MTEGEVKKPPAGAIVKRSVLLAGHRTSVSLEGPFWEELCRLADARGLSLNQLVTEIDASRAGNLSSALRLFVLEEVKDRKAILS